MNNVAYQVPPSALTEYNKCKVGYVTGNEMQRLKNDDRLYGVSAHELAEMFLRVKFGRSTSDAEMDYYRRFTANNLHYNQQMEVQVKQYVDACIKAFNFYQRADKNTGILIEQWLEFGSFSDAKGKVDFAIIGDGVLEIIDFKTGRMKVSAKNNQQMMLYAIALMRMYQKDYGIEKVALTIIQPSVNSGPDRVVMSWQDLLEWGTKHRDSLRNLDLSTDEGAPHCSECRLRSFCVHAAEHFVKEAGYIMSKDPLIHDVNDVADILKNITELNNYAKRFRSDWGKEADERKVVIPGYEVNRSKSDKYFDEKDVIAAIESEYPDLIDVLAPRKPLCVRDMQKAMSELIDESAFSKVISSRGMTTYKYTEPYLKRI